MKPHTASKQAAQARKRLKGKSAEELRDALNEVMCWAKKHSGIPEEQLESIRQVCRRALEP